MCDNIANKNIDNQWYIDELNNLKKEYEDTDEKFTKKKIDILAQMEIIEKILNMRNFQDIINVKI